MLGINCQAHTESGDVMAELMYQDGKIVPLGLPGTLITCLG